MFLGTNDDGSPTRGRGTLAAKPKPRGRASLFLPREKPMATKLSRAQVTKLFARKVEIDRLTKDLYAERDAICKQLVPAILASKGSLAKAGRPLTVRDKFAPVDGAIKIKDWKNVCFERWEILEA